MRQYACSIAIFLLVFLVLLAILPSVEGASWHRVFASFSEREEAGQAAVAACDPLAFQAVRRDLWEVISQIQEERLARGKQDLSGRWDRLFISSLDRYHQLRVDYESFCPAAVRPSEITQETRATVPETTILSDLEELMADIEALRSQESAFSCQKKLALQALRNQLDAMLQQLKRITDQTRHQSVSRRIRYYDLAFEALDLRSQVGDALKSCP